MNREDENILFFAFRYALGRRTAAVSFMVDVLKNRWKDISQKTKDQIKREIRQAVDSNMAGDKCDIEEWEKIMILF